MKYFFNLVIFFLFINYSIVHAKGYQDKGVSGSLSFLYSDEIYDNINSNITQKNFTQEYGINYDGHIYNPNLFSYRLLSLIRFENITQDGSSNNGKTKENSEDFSIDTNFLRSSNYPLRLYYRTSNRPRTSINSGRIINLDSKQDSYGLSGSAKIDKIDINYNISESSNIDNSEDKLQDRTTSQYGASIGYRTEVDSIMLKYLHVTTDTQEYSSGIKTDEIISNDSIDFSYNTKITDTLNLSSVLGYNTSSASDYIVTRGNFNLNWQPNKDYYATAEVAFSRSDIQVLRDVNSTETTLDRTDTFDINEQFNYVLNKNITFAQSLNYFSYEGINSSGDTVSLMLSGIYNKTKNLSPQRIIRYMSSLRTTFRQTNSTSINQDANTTSVINTSDNTNDTAITSKITYTEIFPSINSNLNFDISYIGTKSTKNSKDEYNVGFSLLSNFSSFRNTFDAKYTSLDKQTTISYSDNLYYFMPVGIKGNLNAGIGIEVKETTSSSTTIKSELLKADLNFRYRFFRRLNFLTRFNINKDLGYNTLDYSSETELMSKLGLTSISISYNYDYSYSKTNTNETELIRHILLAKIKRTF